MVTYTHIWYIGIWYIGPIHINAMWLEFHFLKSFLKIHFWNWKKTRIRPLLATAVTAPYDLTWTTERRQHQPSFLAPFKRTSHERRRRSKVFIFILLSLLYGKPEDKLISSSRQAASSNNKERLLCEKWSVETAMSDFCFLEEERKKWKYGEKMPFYCYFFSLSGTF